MSQLSNVDRIGRFERVISLPVFSFTLSVSDPSDDRGVMDDFSQQTRALARTHIVWSLSLNTQPSVHYGDHVMWVTIVQ